jgi:Lysophospholipase
MDEPRKLEVRLHLPATPSQAVPLLFVHGAYSSAAQWEPFFLPYFARHGYASHALSVRGHGGSDGRETVKSARLRDYVADVVEVMQSLPAPPVLIGHSLGGMIVQKVLVDHALPGAVLMCSAPPHGLLGSSLAAMFTNPLMFFQMSQLQRLGPGAATLDGARRSLFLPDTPDDWIRKVLPRAEPESDAVMMDATFRDLPPSRGRRDVPMLVVGGGRDACITTTAVAETARAFGVAPVMFDDLPHALMLVPEWEQVAATMLRWLQDTIPSPTPVP